MARPVARVTFMGCSFGEARESIYIFVFFAHDGAQRRKDEEGRLRAAVWLKLVFEVGGGAGEPGPQAEGRGGGGVVGGGGQTKIATDVEGG